MAAKFPKGEGEWEIHMNSPSRSKIFVRIGMSEEFAQGLRDRDEELNGQLNEDIAETIMTILQLHATQFPLMAVTGPIEPKEKQPTDIHKQKMIRALLRTLAQVLGVGLRFLLIVLFKSGAFSPGGPLQARYGDEETAERELDEIVKTYL